MLKQDLPKIYPITDVKLSGISHAEQITHLTAAGADLIQFRDKDLSSRAFFEEALRAVGAVRDTGGKIIINDRVDVAMLLDADGVHLGQDDLDPAIARQMLGDKKIIGYSTHTLSQVKEAMNQPLDYIAFGPVFVTTTKNDPDPVVGLDMIRQVREMIGNMPLVVIGGINNSNIASVFDAGADSAAIISGLFSDGRSISDNYAALLKDVGEIR